MLFYSDNASNKITSGRIYSLVYYKQSSEM